MKRSFAVRFAGTGHFPRWRESKCGAAFGRRRPDVGWAPSPGGAEDPRGSARLWPRTDCVSRLAACRNWGGNRVVTVARRRRALGVSAEALSPARGSGNLSERPPPQPLPVRLFPRSSPPREVLTTADAGEPALERGQTSQAGPRCSRSRPRVARCAWVKGRAARSRRGHDPQKSFHGHTHNQEWA